MAKGKLIFDLNDFDDRMNYNRCNKSLDMACLLFELKCNRLRKYGKENMTLDEIIEDINLLFEEYNIKLEEIIN